MQKPKVLVDIDGVILDWHEGMRRVLETKGYNYNIEHQTGYRFQGDIGCDPKVISDNFENTDVYTGAPFHYKAKESLELLKTVADVEAYTSSAQTDEIINLRRKLCEDLGIKPNIYKEGQKPVIENILAVFEDCPDNLAKWKDTDTELYLIEHPYNLHCTDRRYIRAYNFHDAVIRFMNRLSRYDCR